MLELLETSRHGRESETPLVLIRDGGGTIFQYAMLGELGRVTYGIAYPHFEDGKRPVHGIPQLAKDYTAAIRETLAKGSVVLGGWSLGGMISLEVARNLQGDAQLHVVGLLMIDSYCPWSTICQSSIDIRPIFRAQTSDRTKRRIVRSFDHAQAMVKSWDRPSSFNPPPTVLIRATQAGFLNDACLEAEDGRLGWSSYQCLPIVSTIDLEGDHFSIFDADGLERMTGAIKEACMRLDNLPHEPGVKSPGPPGEWRSAELLHA